MNRIRPKVSVQDDVLHNDNFVKLEKRIQNQGTDIVWSSLYGHGLLYSVQNIQVIYSCMHFVGGITRDLFANPPEDFLEARFFFIDIFPESSQKSKDTKMMYARCDADFTMEVKSLGTQLEIQDLSEWYHEKHLSKEQVIAKIRYAFKTLLSKD
ncbi:MAG: hypothetical protein AAF518_27985 [Spirochaetota bacterium]